VRRSVTSVRSSVRPSGPKNHRFWDPKSSFLQLYADFGESKSGHFPMSAKMSASDVRKNVRIRCPQKMSASDVRKIVRPILCKSPFGATRPCGKSLSELPIITNFPYNNVLAELKIALKCTVILYMIPKHDSATQIPGARHPLPWQICLAEQQRNAQNQFFQKCAVCG